ncbi:uncharacterized protein LOC143201430 isoform X10 [Rhynchophorus ferrugineus]|uniref:uncharacterized protein LOC143201430 isoform X10 n=1 Tax=Rhynchophorus ferrugineus TaxID=354439 RepID=UPI003FCCE24A
MEFMWSVYCLFVMFLVYIFLQWRIKLRNNMIGYCRIAQPFAQPQDQNVFNISSRVQGQEQRHPDAFVSLEHITIMNELNKPPKYDDAPPSYEEAIKIAMAQDNSLKTFQTEVAASQGTSSSSSAAATSSAATPQIQPAIPNRTE